MKGRDTIEIDHPPGDEIQWDWFERRGAPWGEIRPMGLRGTLPLLRAHPWGAAEGTDQAHLVEAMGKVLRRLGGTARSSGAPTAWPR